VAPAPRRESDGWIHRHRLIPSHTMTFDGPDAVKRAVMAGLGIAIVSKSTVGEELTSRRLVLLKLALTLPAREFYLVDHPQKHHGAACGAMLRLLTETFADSHLTLRPDQLKKSLNSSDLDAAILHEPAGTYAA